MDLYKETPQQKEIADYNVYLQLKQLKYTNIDIANHLSYTKEELGCLVSQYTFKNNLEYKLQESEGDYHFNGTFYVTQNVNTCLTPDEILEIYTFTQDMVKQHKGIDYIQSFYSIEQDCELFFVDNLSMQMIKSDYFSKLDNYCMLMLASDY